MQTIKNAKKGCNFITVISSMSAATAKTNNNIDMAAALPKVKLIWELTKSLGWFF
jgi:hypothetical protein